MLLAMHRQQQQAVRPGGPRFGASCSGFAESVTRIGPEIDIESEVPFRGTEPSGVVRPCLFAVKDSAGPEDAVFALAPNEGGADAWHIAAARSFEHNRSLLFA